MATEKNISHKVVTDLRIPYKTFDSPISTDLMWQDGANLFVNLRGYAQRRAGFSGALCTTTFTNLKREFLWNRWSGTPNAGYYAMYCDISSGVAKVYKQRIGMDAAASLIWTSTSAEPFDFVVDTNLCFFGNGTDMKYFDGANVWNWGFSAPAAPTIGTSLTGLTTFVGAFYRTTYVNQNAGHESSPSGLSACTGVVTNVGFDVTWVASSDPQVTHVNVYRTTDGGSTNPAEMLLVATAPVGDLTYHDTTLDDNLHTQTCPALYRNDPPPPGKGFVSAVNRIWYFQGNKLYYTGYEEISTGVAPMCVPGALDGNTRPYPKEIRGLAELSQGALSSGCAIFCDNNIYSVQGDSLQTFTWGSIMSKRGALSRTAIKSVGGSVVWLDTASQVWLDGSEIGLDIRPDIAGIDHSQAYIDVHIAGEHHWVVLLDGGRNKLFVYDIDTKQWYVPWTVSASCVHSGMIGLGNTVLLAGINGKALYQVDGSYKDNTTPYSAFVKTNLFDITSGQKPEWTGVVDWLALETNSTRPSVVAQMNDDSTSAGTYTSITANAEAPFARGQGSAVLKTIYPSSPTPMKDAFGNDQPSAAQRVSFRLDWPADASAFELYSIDVASHPAVSK